MKIKNNIFAVCFEYYELKAESHISWIIISVWYVLSPTLHLLIITCHHSSFPYVKIQVTASS